METSPTRLALPASDCGRLGICDSCPSIEQKQANVADRTVDAAAKTVVVEAGR